MNILSGIFLILHGLVHFWYVTMSQGWVELKADMGWTGKSWLLGSLLKPSLLHPTASVLYGLAAIAFVISGILMLINPDSSRIWLWISTILSSLTLIIFWDGNVQYIVQKGLIGLIINVIVLILLILG